MKSVAKFSPVDVAVIGAGMAGLSTAAHARLSGLSVRVFERHTTPGGVCTSWRRNGYVFDYCVEYFMGSGKGQGFYGMWKDLGIIDATEFRHIDSFGRYVGQDGQFLELYTDYRRLREHMLVIAPEDARRIGELCEAIRKASHFVMTEFPLSREGLSRFAESLPALFVMKKYASVSVRQWCAELRNPFLREAIPPLVGTVDFPMAGPIMVFGLMSADKVAYPLGGSLPLARAVEARAKSLGAEFVYNLGVTHVLVDGGKATGVELDDGRVQQARYVVAACDARTTFDCLLQGRVKSAAYEAMFESSPIHPTVVQVSLGVGRDPRWGLSETPNKTSFPLSRPIIIDGRERHRITIRHYANDPRMAPEGGTVMLVQYEADYDRWKALRADRDGYKAEKERILAETARALEELFPGIGSRIDANDVATPTTCERYTGNWRGSTQGWVIPTGRMKNLLSDRRLPKTFTAVSGFYLIGQWTEPGGGLPPTARNGRDVVRAIMKTDGKKAAR